MLPERPEGALDQHPARLPNHPGGVLLEELRLQLSELSGHLYEHLVEGQWLDAFLFAAGATQVLDDQLDHHRLVVARVAEQVERDAGWLGHAGTSLRAGGRMWSRRPVSLPRTDRLEATRGTLGWLALELADAALGRPPTAAARSHLEAGAERFSTEISNWPRRDQRGLLRPPSCFRSFDQHPRDVVALVRQFEDSFPDEDVPVLVVGVRTSGSYLAPLAAAELRHSRRTVKLMSLRPGVVPRRRDVACVGEVMRAGGLVLLIDDPPVGGGALANVARELEAAGVPTDAVVVAVALAGDEADIAAPLRRYPRVAVAWPDWDIHARLSPSGAMAGLSTVVGGGQRVAAVHRVPGGRAKARGHSWSRFDVELVDGSGATNVLTVVAEGAGLGFFGRHAVAVSRRMGDNVPRVWGFHDGVLFRSWVPTSTPVEPEHLTTAVADHVAYRHQALAVAEDRSIRLGGQQPAWEVAATILARPLGRAAPAGRVAAIGGATRRLMRCPTPSVVDGRTDWARWLVTSDGRVVKLDFAEGAFGSLDLATYDPMHDLAGAAAGGSDQLVAGLVERYEARTGESLSRERFLLHVLVHLWDRLRRNVLSAPVVAAQSGQAVNAYLASRYLGDLAPPEEGPWCAIDLDGVLEHDGLGFPATTPSGALCIRALLAHGYQPLIVSGRALADVAERCRIFRLPGGVAEYGTALWHDNRGHQLLGEQERHTVSLVTSRLAEAAGIEIDPAYRAVTRAWTVDGGNRRGPIPDAFLEALLGPGAREELRVVHGQGQTDLVPVRHTKATGATALLDRLDRNGPVVRQCTAKRVDMAVGDTASDVPLFELAERAFAPANADGTVRRAGVCLLDQSYQLGLLAAVSQLLGHRAGGCSRCRPPRFGADSRRLLALLALGEGGRRSLPSGMARLVAVELAHAVRNSP